MEILGFKWRKELFELYYFEEKLWTSKKIFLTLEIEIPLEKVCLLIWPSQLFPFAIQNFAWRSPLKIWKPSSRIDYHQGFPIFLQNSRLCRHSLPKDLMFSLKDSSTTYFMGPDFSTSVVLLDSMSLRDWAIRVFQTQTELFESSKWWKEPKKNLSRISLDKNFLFFSGKWVWKPDKVRTLGSSDYHINKEVFLNFLKTSSFYQNLEG